MPAPGSRCRSALVAGPPRAVARPGTLNLMTAGRGIAHAEETPPENSGRLHGFQLWVALLDADRHAEPAFDHITSARAVASWRSGRARPDSARC